MPTSKWSCVCHQVRSSATDKVGKLTYLTRNESCDWSSQWKWNTRILSVFCGSRPLGWTIVPDAASGTSVLGAGYLCEQLISAPFPQDSEKCKQIADKPGGTKFKVRLLEKLILFPHLPLEEMKELSSKTRCGNFRIFLLPRFYVKSILEKLGSKKVQKIEKKGLDLPWWNVWPYSKAQGWYGESCPHLQGQYLLVSQGSSSGGLDGSFPAHYGLTCNQNNRKLKNQTTIFKAFCRIDWDINSRNLKI